MWDKLGEKGVTPVVGTILLLAITVILASIVATFVFNLANDKLEMARRTAENLQKSLENYASGP